MVHTPKTRTHLYSLFQLLWIIDKQIPPEFKTNIFYSHTLLINYEYLCFNDWNCMCILTIKLHKNLQGVILSFGFILCILCIWWCLSLGLHVSWRRGTGTTNHVVLWRSSSRVAMAEFLSWQAVIKTDIRLLRKHFSRARVTVVTLE